MVIIESNDKLKSKIDENNNIIILESLNCDFNIDVDANIIAWNINARDINAKNINAWNINARDINTDDINAWDINAKDINAWNINSDNINAKNISYYAVCFAYNNIICKSIIGRRSKSKHFVLDGKIIITEDDK